MLGEFACVVAVWLWFDTDWVSRVLSSSSNSVKKSGGISLSLMVGDLGGDFTEVVWLTLFVLVWCLDTCLFKSWSLVYLFVHRVQS